MDEADARADGDQLCQAGGQNVVENVRAITEGKGSNFFLFIDQETLAASNPLAAMWTLKTPTKLSMCTLLGADRFDAYHCNHRIRGPDIPARRTSKNAFTLPTLELLVG